MISETTIKFMTQAKGLLELCIQGAENRTTDEAQMEHWLQDVIKFCRMAILNIPGTTIPIPTAPTQTFKPNSPEREMEDDYKLPTCGMLNMAPNDATMTPEARAELVDLQQTLCQAMKDFKIDMEPGNITQGASFTRFEFYPPKGLRMSRITHLTDNLMLAAQAKSINILAPIPGKNTVGIELENKVKKTVYLREILQSEEFQNSTHRIPLALGKDVYGTPIIADLSTMPHLLMAGKTDSGKSVCLNSMLLSMLYKFNPNELKLILADPKVVDLQPYKKLPHLLCPLLTAPERVIGALRWVVNEMEYRLKLFRATGVSNVEEFNNRTANGTAETEVEGSIESYYDEADVLISDLDDMECEDDCASEMPEKLPYIVFVINELADYMLLAKDDIENYIAKIAQKARAAGIHLIISTQIPRSNVLTGLIKANIPSRIAFKVSSPLDSRIILDVNGAENLLGHGDFFFNHAGSSRNNVMRIQGTFVSDPEIAYVVRYCASSAKQNFEQNVTAERNEPVCTTDSEPPAGKDMSDEDAELYSRCVQLVISERKASTSLLQRRFSIGFGRAAKMMDMMEKRGVIGPAAGNLSRPREVLIYHTCTRENN
ncbi:MAG: DNA translocase FtsK [Akkermansiaceae bacterium]|nr:DNA translocase FtsK [Akkermansiaceae bacterium]